MHQQPRAATKISAAEHDDLVESLQEAVQARDEFVAIAAHELRNPMTPILLQVESLRNACSNPARCKPDILVPRLQILEEAVKEFIRRATVLLDVTRVAAGSITIEPAFMDLSALVGMAATRMGIAARLARAPIELDVQENVTGHWDSMALGQVVDNLLSNAIKFGSGQPVSLSVRAEGQIASVTVSDRGIGISEEDRERIFQRFERAVTKREHGGFGIGLWLSNQLVQAMGGRIDVAGRAGGGTSFTVCLPIAVAEARS